MCSAASAFFQLRRYPASFTLTATAFGLNWFSGRAHARLCVRLAHTAPSRRKESRNRSKTRYSPLPPTLRRSVSRMKRHTRSGVTHRNRQEYFSPLADQERGAIQGIIPNIFGSPSLQAASSPLHSTLSSNYSSPPVTVTTSEESETAPFRDIATQETFQRFPLPNRMQHTLMSLGYTIPTWIQEHSIPVLLSGSSAVLVAECGSGKTAAYLIPLISRLYNSDTHHLAPYPNAPRLLVITPTQELVTQTERTIKRLSRLPSLGISLGGSSLVREYQSLVRGCDIVVGTPRRILTHIERGSLRLARLEAFVIDEADVMCVAPWEEEVVALLKLMRVRHHRVLSQSSPPGRGRPHTVQKLVETVQLKESSEYLSSCQGSPQLPQSSTNNGATQTTGKNGSTRFPVSPTATLRHQSGVRRSLGFLQAVLVTAVKTTGLNLFINRHMDGVVGTRIASIVSPRAHTTQGNSVRQVFVPLKDASRMERLNEILQESISNYRSASVEHQDKVLIFTNSIRSCGYVARALKQSGYSAEPLHGDLPPRQRRQNVTDFRSGNIQILVATNIASRGLDLPSVGHVILFSLTKRLVDYIHRVGRVCRNGAPGRITSLYSRRDQHIVVQAQRLSQGRSVDVQKPSSSLKRNLLSLRNWQLEMVQRVRKVTRKTRKSLGVSPRHACGIKKRWLMKKEYFRAKELQAARQMYKRGLISKYAPFPRLPNPLINASETQSYTKVVRGMDGLLQATPHGKPDYVVLKRRVSKTNVRAGLPSRPSGANRPALNLEQASRIITTVQRESRRKNF